MDSDVSAAREFTLEEDILMYILSFLSTNDVRQAMCVCRAWNTVVCKRNLQVIASTREKLEQKHTFLKDAIIYQILRLKKFNQEEAIPLLVEYYEFRKCELGRFSHPSDVIRTQIEERKAFWCRNDISGRPLLVIRPRLHIPQKLNPTLLYAVYMFEEACERIWRKSSIKDFCVLVDFKGFSTKNFDQYFARTCITWSRRYFKNILGACYCINSPTYATVCWNIIKIFVPPETLKKISIFKKDEWQPVLSANFASSNLPIQYGGTWKVPGEYKMEETSVKSFPSLRDKKSKKAPKSPVQEAQEQDVIAAVARSNSSTF